MRPEYRAPSHWLPPGAAHLIRQVVKLPLFGEYTGERVDQRQPGIPALNCFRAGTVDLDNLELPSPQLLGRSKANVESAVVKFPTEFSRNARQCAEWRLEHVKKEKQSAD